MITEDDYIKRIDRLKPIALDWMKNKSPEEGMELVSKMDPVDAYIIGRIIGAMAQAKINLEHIETAVQTALMSHGIRAVPLRKVSGPDFRFN